MIKEEIRAKLLEEVRKDVCVILNKIEDVKDKNRRLKHKNLKLRVENEELKIENRDENEKLRTEI
jgi:hypothetical protein